jgi:hypothetical protein
MSYQNIIREITLPHSQLQLNPPAPNPTIIESEFKLNMPLELIDFYKETNGIVEIMDEEVIGDLIWSVERLIQENQSYRTNPEFEDWLFIADAGNGDNFGYAIHENSIPSTNLYVWNHEDESKTWVAPNLEAFVIGWTSGEIQI